MQEGGFAMTKTSEEPPVTVLARAKHPGKSLTYLILRSEPTIWTARMLTALLEGVKGGKWYSLMDKIHPERTLSAAFTQVAANRERCLTPQPREPARLVRNGCQHGQAR